MSKVDGSALRPLSSAQSAPAESRVLDRVSPKAVRRGNNRPPRPVLKTKYAPPDLSAQRIEKRYNITDGQVARIIASKHGLLTDVAKHFKIPYTTMARYVKQRPVCQEAMTSARERLGDMAENKLFELIKAGDVRCLLYYLSTVHRNRGYGLRPTDDPFGGGVDRPVYVETINVVAVPSGKFLPPQTIEHE